MLKPGRCLSFTLTFKVLYKSVTQGSRNRKDSAFIEKRVTGSNPIPPFQADVSTPH